MTKEQIRDSFLNNVKQNLSKKGIEIDISKNSFDYILASSIAELASYLIK